MSFIRDRRAISRGAALFLALLLTLPVLGSCSRQEEKVRELIYAFSDADTRMDAAEMASLTYIAGMDARAREEFWTAEFKKFKNATH
jgi:hypothetical protein